VAGRHEQWAEQRLPPVSLVQIGATAAEAEVQDRHVFDDSQPKLQHLLMGRLPDHLNELQLEVLSWVRDGTPAGDYDTGHRRITASGLHNRGFILVAGKREAWQASITEKGLLALETAAAVPAELDGVRLLRQVLDAPDNELSMRRSDVSDAKRLIAQSLASAFRPHGRTLSVKSGGYYSDTVTWILEEYLPDLVEEKLVAPTTDLRHPHAVVEAFLNDAHWQRVTTKHLQRAATILQTIAVEAESRGFIVLVPSSPPPTGMHNSEGHMTVENGGAAVQITIREIQGKNQEASRNRVHSPRWQAVFYNGFVSSGKLQLELGRVYSPTATYKDTARRPLEEQISALFKDLEVEFLRLHRAQDERDKSEAAALLRRQKAEARAEVALQLAHKVATLDEQVTAWSRARNIRDYAAHLRKTDSSPASRREWAEWALAYADSIDPSLRQDLAVPADREFTSRDLNTFL